MDLIRATEISEGLSRGEMAFDIGVIKQLQEVTEKLVAQAECFVALQVEVTELAALGILTSLTAIDEIGETRRTGVCLAGSRLGRPP